MPSLELSEHTETKLEITWFYLILSFFTNKDLELVSLPHFLHDFLKKYISFVIFYYLTKSHCLIAYTSWDIGQYV